jgi:hypothetical protein
MVSGPGCESSVVLGGIDGGATEERSPVCPADSKDRHCNGQDGQAKTGYAKASSFPGRDDEDDDVDYDAPYPSYDRIVAERRGRAEHLAGWYPDLSANRVWCLAGLTGEQLRSEVLYVQRIGKIATAMAETAKAKLAPTNHRSCGKKST